MILFGNKKTKQELRVTSRFSQQHNWSSQRNFSSIATAYFAAASKIGEPSQKHSESYSNGLLNVILGDFGRINARKRIKN